MANNRMYLVHKSTGDAILLAKYYPSTGWHMFHDNETYDTFFDRSKNYTMFGDIGFVLRFEIDEDKIGVGLTGEENFPFNNPSEASQ